METKKRKRYPYFYERNKLKQVSGFVSKEDYERLRRLARDADKSLVRYVTRLLESHIKERDTEDDDDSSSSRDTGPTERPH